MFVVMRQKQHPHLHVQSPGGHRGVGAEAQPVFGAVGSCWMSRRGRREVSLEGRVLPCLHLNQPSRTTLFSVTETLPRGYSTSEMSSASSKRVVSSWGVAPT